MRQGVEEGAMGEEQNELGRDLEVETLNTVGGYPVMPLKINTGEYVSA